MKLFSLRLSLVFFFGCGRKGTTGRLIAVGMFYHASILLLMLVQAKSIGDGRNMKNWKRRKIGRKNSTIVAG